MSNFKSFSSLNQTCGDHNLHTDSTTAERWQTVTALSALGRYCILWASVTKIYSLFERAVYILLRTTFHAIKIQRWPAPSLYVFSSEYKRVSTAARSSYASVAMETAIRRHVSSQSREGNPSRWKTCVISLCLRSTACLRHTYHLFLTFTFL